MEPLQRKVKVLFNKPGGTASKNASVMARITLPSEYIKELGITPDNKEVLITLENNKIIIEKA